MQKVTYVLFTTATCPKCPAMKSWLQDDLDNCQGETIDNTAPNFMEKAEQYQVTMAPTCIFFDASDQEVFRTSDLGSLIDYAHNHLST